MDENLQRHNVSIPEHQPCDKRSANADGRILSHSEVVTSRDNTADVFLARSTRHAKDSDVVVACLLAKAFGVPAAFGESTEEGFCRRHACLYIYERLGGIVPARAFNFISVFAVISMIQ